MEDNIRKKYNVGNKMYIHSYIYACVCVCMHRYMYDWVTLRDSRNGHKIVNQLSFNVKKVITYKALKYCQYFKILCLCNTNTYF